MNKSLEFAIEAIRREERQRIAGCVTAEALMMANEEDQAVAISIAAKILCDFMRDAAAQAEMNGRDA